MRRPTKFYEQRKKNIVCLFSDIRNYTNSTKNIDNFLDRSAIPNIKLITSITDKNNGISRLIGDLVLAYFDDESFEKNITQSFLSATSICIENNAYNIDLSDDLRINRFVILTSGEAIVGNIGSLDHSREITAMGPCVNFTERLDRITKHSSFQAIVPFDSIVMDLEMAESIQKSFEDVPVEYFDIATRNLFIQNYEEIEKIAFIDVIKWMKSKKSDLKE